MTAPRIERLSMFPLNGRTAGFALDAWPKKAIIGQVQDACLMALEIDTESEVDQVIVECSSGTFLLAVGSPCLGPLKGPFIFKAYYPVPFLAGVTLFDRVPTVSIRCHYEMPQAFVRCRAPWFYSAIAQVAPGALATVLEAPWFGRKRGSIRVIANTNNHDFRIRLRQYLGHHINPRFQDDATGTIVVAPATSSGKRIFAEECHTLSIELGSLGGTYDIGVELSDEVA